MANEAKGVRATLSEGQNGLFSKGTYFYGHIDRNGNYNYSNHLVPRYREMTIGQRLESGPHAKRKWVVESFSDARYMGLPSDYKGYGKHSTKKGLMTKKTWQTFGLTSDGVYKLKNIKEMVLQMTIAAHQISIASEHYRIVLAQRALKIFQDSFTLKRFNSAGEKHWEPLTEWTRNKRRRTRNRLSGEAKRQWPKPGDILRETGNLYKSLEFMQTIKPFTSGVRANAKYAGIHNDPRPGETYGDGWGGLFSPLKPVTRRQFMGHSTLLDDFVRIYEKAYLFDTVFRKPA